MICDSSVWPCIEKPPKSWASVFTTPSLALLAGDGADRADQLVFDRDAAVDERDHDLVEARAEGDAEEDFLAAADAVVDACDALGLDAVGPLGERGVFAEGFDLMDVDDDLAAAHRAELGERREQVELVGAYSAGTCGLT